ncbi:MAG: hypothetical protein AB1512_13550 [Thermodesulfobacteriota bacterium]
MTLVELLLAIAPFIWVWLAERQYRKDREKELPSSITLQPGETAHVFLSKGQSIKISIR